MKNREREKEIGRCEALLFYVHVFRQKDIFSTHSYTDTVYIYNEKL